MSNRLVTATLILIMFAAAVKAGEPGSKKDDVPDEKIMRGKDIYNNTCLFCHGAEGKGARAPSLVTGPYAPGGGNDDDYMFDVIKNGRPGTIMGSFGGTLTDEEIKSVIKFLRHKAEKIAEETTS